MSAEGWVLIIGAAGAQLGMILQTIKTGRAVGKPNGSGTVTEQLARVEKKMDVFCERLSAVERKVM